MPTINRHRWPCSQRVYVEEKEISSKQLDECAPCIRKMHAVQGFVSQCGASCLSPARHVIITGRRGGISIRTSYP